jgi:chromosome segregation ATPase
LQVLAQSLGDSDARANSVLDAALQNVQSFRRLLHGDGDLFQAADIAATTATASTSRRQSIKKETKSDALPAPLATELEQRAAEARRLLQTIVRGIDRVRAGGGASAELTAARAQCDELHARARTADARALALADRVAAAEQRALETADAAHAADEARQRAELRIAKANEEIASLRSALAVANASIANAAVAAASAATASTAGGATTQSNGVAGTAEVCSRVCDCCRRCAVDQQDRAL